jgi:tripartite-type tricarboxylate transporter receptor subunit TctC
MLSVKTSLPARSVKELIALAKSHPGKLNFGSAGTGNATHLLGELLKSKAGIEITHVPYKGVGPALAAVVGGQMDMVFGSISGTAPHAKAGRVRSLAITSMKRSAAVPDVPTLHEAGVPGFDAVGWWGVLAPAGTSAGIVRKMNAEINAIVNESKTQKWLESQGFEAAPGTAAEFARFIKSEIAKWREIVKTSGAQLD